MKYRKPTCSRPSNNRVNKRSSAFQCDSAKVLILRDLTKNFLGIIKVKANKDVERVKVNHLPTEKAKTQFIRVFECFMERPKTMLDVSLETGILRANICRYVARYRKAGKIQIHHFAKDAHTRMMSAYYTTNTALFSQQALN